MRLASREKRAARLAKLTGHADDWITDLMGLMFVIFVLLICWAAGSSLGLW